MKKNTFLEAISCSKLRGGQTGHLGLGAHGHSLNICTFTIDSKLTIPLQGLHLTCCAQGQKLGTKFFESKKNFKYNFLF